MNPNDFGEPGLFFFSVCLPQEQIYFRGFERHADNYHTHCAFTFPTGWTCILYVYIRNQSTENDICLSSHFSLYWSNIHPVVFWVIILKVSYRLWLLSRFKAVTLRLWTQWGSYIAVHTPNVCISDKRKPENLVIWDWAGGVDSTSNFLSFSCR